MSQIKPTQTTYQEAFQLHQNGQLDQALKSYLNIIKNEKKHIDCYCQIADIYMQQNKPAEAIEGLKKALKHNTDDPMLLNMISAIFRHLGTIDQAIIYAERLYKIQPKQLETIFNLASLYSMSGDMEVSYKLFMDLMKINPAIPEVHYNLGNIYFNQNKLEEAAQAFQNAIKYNPKLTPAYSNLSITLSSLNRQNEAFEILKQGLLLDADNFGMNKQIGMIYHSRNELETTRKHYEKAYQNTPDDTEMLLLMGNLCRDESQTDDAIAFYKKVLIAEPNHVAAQESLSMLSRNKIPSWHFPMLADTGRNNAYDNALKKIIRPAHTVLDIGTGSGLLAMMAARAGAKEVIACEMNKDLADIATRIVSKNKLDKFIKVVHKKSSALDIGVDMPQKADVLVSEILDTGLLGEGVFPSVRHAQQELLNKDAIMIPKSADMYGVLVQCDALKKTRPIQDISGFDLSIFNEFQTLNQYSIFHSEQESYQELSAVFPIHSYDFYNIPEERTQDNPHRKSFEVTASASGEFQAILFWFQLHLDNEISLSSGPNGEMKHWGQAIYFFPETKSVNAGDAIQLELLQSDYLISFDCK